MPPLPLKVRVNLEELLLHNSTLWRQNVTQVENEEGFARKGKGGKNRE